MLGLVLSVLLARSVLRLLRRLLLAGVIAGLLLIVAHGQLSRVPHQAFWRSQVKTVQRDVQTAVQHALSGAPARRVKR